MTADGSFDVVVVGAGTAGLQAAYQLADVGFDVAVVEKRSERRSGARWCNGVLDWQFERAGIAGPQAPEARSRGGRIRMSSPDRTIRFTMESSPTIDADMRLLVERLQGYATDAGVTFHWGARDIELESVAGRPVAVGFDHDGEPVRLTAKLFVDATGLAAVLRRQVLALDGACPDVAPTDTCSARQMVFEIESVAGAKEFLEAEAAEPGDAVDHLGLAGGYSVQVITVEADLAEVSVLVGTLGDGTYGDAAAMVAAVRDRHSWIGKPVFGGGGTIPLRRPYSQLGVPGLVLVGDAASQVMAAHGSGIGFGLMAGKVLAEAAAGAEDPGDAATVWRYQSSYHREFGAVLISYDIFRCYSTRLDSSGIQRLFEAGLFDARLAAPGMNQAMGSIPLSDLADRVRALARNPRIARDLAPVLVRMQLARLLARVYPATPNAPALSRWDRWAHRLVAAPGRTATS